MARSHHEPEASPAASPYKPTNPRLSRPSLIPEEPEFNLEYLQFAFQQDPERLYEQILEALHQRDDAKAEAKEQRAHLAKLSLQCNSL
jgi:hypothetical protein